MTAHCHMDIVSNPGSSQQKWAWTFLLTVLTDMTGDHWNILRHSHGGAWHCSLAFSPFSSTKKDPLSRNYFVYFLQASQAASVVAALFTDGLLLIYFSFLFSPPSCKHGKGYYVPGAWTHLESCSVIMGWMDPPIEQEQSIFSANEFSKDKI